MAETVSVHEAFVDVVQEGDRWRGYITTPWFRYLVASNPEGFGTGTGVLHGNASGAPTWGPVDLATDVTGVLPAANGGLGGITGIAGGLLYATGASSYSVTAAGTTHQVLHGGATPTWGAVNISADTTGTLPVLRGGTGVTTSTGSGSVVLNNGPSLINTTVTVLTVNGTNDSTVALTLLPDTLGGGAGQQNGQVISNNARVVSINAGTPTALLGLPWGTFFVLLDQTSGGMAMGVMDAIGGISVTVNTMVGVALTMSAGFLLQAKVTAGTSPRNISVFGVVLQT